MSWMLINVGSVLFEKHGLEIGCLTVMLCVFLL